MAALDFPTSPTDGDTYAGYTYNGTKGVWEWDVVTPSLASLSDTTIATPTSGDSLVYDGTDWVNSSSEVLGDNLLYNGAMQVTQRGTSATGIGNGDTGFYTADRWRFAEGGAATAEFTQTIEADGPTGSGFTKSLKMACTTADVSLGADEFFIIMQQLEGQDLQGLKKGTSSAESLTLSFWVKSDATGTYVVELRDVDNTRSISAAYTVASAGTWEKKTVTFAGDTTGAFDNDNAASLQVNWWLLAGTDYTSGSLATSWGSLTNANRAVGQVNLATSTNYWQITGMKLETGAVATPFEHKSYGEELAECQRYYYRVQPDAAFARLAIGYNTTTTSANFIFLYPTTMRTSPTALEQSGTAGDYEIQHGATVTVLSAVPEFRQGTTNNGAISTTVASGLTAGQGSIFRGVNTNAYLAWSAEL